MNAIKFVTIWNTAKNIDAVVELTGLTRGACHARASTYRRKHDIPLKSFETARLKWDDVKRAAEEALLEETITADTEETSDQS